MNSRLLEVGGERCVQSFCDAGDEVEPGIRWPEGKRVASEIRLRTLASTKGGLLWRAACLKEWMR